MHQLVIDIGNTHYKIGLFDGRKQVWWDRWEEARSSDLERLIKEHKVKRFTISSVGPREEALIAALSVYATYVPFSTMTAAGITNAYETPHTLGADRWAAVIGAKASFPDASCLIVDVGTCITYDLLTEGKRYEGGSISPGIQMRLKAMHQYTGRLPLAEWDRSLPIPEGKNTRDALLRGTLQGVVNEVMGFISLENKKNKALHVLLTGGDADFLMEQLKNSIFASQIRKDPYLVLKGLNEVITLSDVSES